LPHRFRKRGQSMRPGDRVAYYIMGLQKFGATATITGEYYHDDQTRLWTDEDEIWPTRCPSAPDVVLQDDELVDAKKLVPDLGFIRDKDHWGTFLQGSIRTIPEDDFRLIESEMRKALSERTKQTGKSVVPPREDGPRTEEDYGRMILALPLQTTTLHDRLAEMLESIGSWMDFNPQTRHKIAADHAYELDVAWLRAKNPEVAVEVQISGNLTEAKDRLAQARKFNYRKVILVLREKDMTRLNALMRHEPDLRSWMEAWSIGAVYEMYVAGGRFFKYYRQMIEAVYRDKKELELVE